MSVVAEPIGIPNKEALRAWWRFRRWLLREFPASVRAVDVGPVTERAKHGWLIVWSTP